MPGVGLSSGQMPSGTTNHNSGPKDPLGRPLGPTYQGTSNNIAPDSKYKTGLTAADIAALDAKNPNQLGGSYQYGGAVFGGAAPSTNGYPPPPGGSPSGSGSRRRGGGGGGGPAPAGIDQKSYDAYWAARNGYKPAQYEYTPYEYQDMQFADQVAPEFRKWDPSLYNTTREGITTGFQGMRQQGNTALDQAKGAWGGMANQFTGRDFTKSQGIDPRLQASMAAFGGAGAGDGMMQAMEGVSNDNAMSAVYDLLGSSTEQYRGDQLRAVEGDRMNLNQRLSGEENLMNMQVNMTEAAAKTQYDKDLFEHGKEYADKNYDKNLQIALMNNQGRNSANLTNNQGQNQADQANVLGGNQWNEQGLAAFLEMLGLGMNGAGKQTLDLTKGWSPTTY